MYTITLISSEEKDRLTAKYQPRIRYELKSELYGCCLKLISDDHTLKDTWEDNFYSMSQNVRSHGRILVFKDPDYTSDTVLYDAYSKTMFLFNFEYYGWIKSLALSLAGDILEDEHDIFSVHGACVDIGGTGVCLVGASGAGKTTQTYGLLKDPHTRIVSDDWFFSRVYGSDILGYGSEKNFYIGNDLERIWKEYEGLVKEGAYDYKGRAIADIRWIIGKGRILPMTTLKIIIVLKRDSADKNQVQTLAPEPGLKLFTENNYFNPHLLVRNPLKAQIRKRYLQNVLGRTTTYLVNTTGTPAETQMLIRSLIGVAQAK